MKMKDEGGFCCAGESYNGAVLSCGVFVGDESEICCLPVARVPPFRRTITKNGSGIESLATFLAWICSSRSQTKLNHLSVGNPALCALPWTKDA